ncbi:sensor histidine kinase [Lentzea albidocapillata]|uniref:Sensor-like histidine kinase SenX3 n=1 Tax=Lentzea albidocapillata TaxID=40571 RepID=A0A1W2EA61_9PSEU|nr:HAMP domain-containing sensor histidine kinase [Lentzea albidocapillata]SMD06669.1 Signal transduction histidine kinase [Lentzea albidocapillata]
MDHSDALRALSSDAPSERLEAARYLQFWAVPTDIAILRTRLQVEPVGWVRRAIEDALLRLGDTAAHKVDLQDYIDESGDNPDEAAKARVRITQTVVHELSPIVSAIDYFIRAEWPQFEESKTKRHVERLIRFISAIDTLGGISSSATMRDTNLAVVISNCVEAQQIAFGIHIEIDGPSSVDAYTDPDLVELIVSNGLKNACESACQIANGEPAVSVLYGGSDREFWVNVVDNGAGIPMGSSGRLFKIGSTTKEGHLGMGLALCVEAAESITAKIRLSSGDRGTKFEVTLPIGGGERAGSSGRG